MSAAATSVAANAFNRWNWIGESSRARVGERFTNQHEMFTNQQEVPSVDPLPIFFLNQMRDHEIIHNSLYFMFKVVNIVVTNLKNQTISKVTFPN